MSTLVSPDSNNLRLLAAISVGITATIALIYGGTVFQDGAIDEAAAQTSGNTVTISFPSGSQTSFKLEASDSAEIVSTSGGASADSYGNECFGIGDGGSVTVSYSGSITEFNAGSNVEIEVDGNTVSKSEFVSNYMTCSGDTSTSGSSSSTGTGSGTRDTTFVGDRIQDPSDYSFGTGYPLGCGDTVTVSSKSGLENAVSSASPCDIIRVEANANLNGEISISNSGELNKPIVITGASSDPSNYPVIDGGSECMQITGESWLMIKNLKFRDCNRAIEIEDSYYLTVHSSRFLNRVAYPVHDNNDGEGTGDHILIQNSYWKPAPDEMWSDWDWGTMKNGGEDWIAQSTIYGPRSDGNVIIRNNEMSYTFNAVRFLPTMNTEVYGNEFHHIRDNVIEPEGYIYNMHVYHNEFNNIDPAPFSYDGNNGGWIYQYGNIGHYDRDDPSARYKRKDGQAGHLYKFVHIEVNDGPFLDHPFYIVHNSYHDYAFGFKADKVQDQVKHLNNAYYFGHDMGLGLGSWGDHLETANFDYDILNKGWDSELDDYGHEQNGMKYTDPEFQDPGNGNFRPASGSPLIDGGTTIDGFTQSVEGSAPDVGAYDGQYLVNGPPFQVEEHDNGPKRDEHPRITRHSTSGSELSAYFSWPLQPASLSAGDVSLSADGTAVDVTDVSVGSEGREVTFTTNQDLEGKDLQLCFDQLPVGTNGRKATYWGSTVGCS